MVERDVRRQDAEHLAFAVAQYVRVGGHHTVSPTLVKIGFAPIVAVEAFGGGIPLLRVIVVGRIAQVSVLHLAFFRQVGVRGEQLTLLRIESRLECHTTADNVRVGPHHHTGHGIKRVGIAEAVAHEPFHVFCRRLHLVQDVFYLVNGAGKFAPRMALCLLAHDAFGGEEEHGEHHPEHHRGYHDHLQAQAGGKGLPNCLHQIHQLFGLLNTT